MRTFLAGSRAAAAWLRRPIFTVVSADATRGPGLIGPLSCTHNQTIHSHAHGSANDFEAGGVAALAPALSRLTGLTRLDLRCALSLWRREAIHGEGTMALFLEGKGGHSLGADSLPPHSHLHPISTMGTLDPGLWPLER